MPDEYCIGKIIEINEKERRHNLSDAEIDVIAERLQSKMYEQIGKSVIAKLFWLVGVISVSVYVYLTHFYPKI